MPPKGKGKGRPAPMPGRRRVGNVNGNLVSNPETRRVKFVAVNNTIHAIKGQAVMAAPLQGTSSGFKALLQALSDCQEWRIVSARITLTQGDTTGKHALYAYLCPRSWPPTSWAEIVNCGGKGKPAASFDWSTNTIGIQGEYVPHSASQGTLYCAVPTQAEDATVHVISTLHIEIEKRGHR